MSELTGVYASFDQLTPAIADQLWNDGYRVFSQQLWTAGSQPSHRVENLRIAHDKGFKLVGPIAISSTGHGGAHVDAARTGVPDDLWDALCLTPIDVELQGIPNPEIRAAVDHALVLGKRRSIYFSMHTWVDNQGNSDGFKDCLLYVAQYDNVMSVAYTNLPSSLEGGFVVGKQATNSMDTDGLTTCREVWNDYLLIPGSTVPVVIPATPLTLEGEDAAIKFLSAIAVSQEARLAKLEGGK